MPNSGIMLWLVKCLHVDGFAVLLTVSRSFSFTLLLSGKRFFKTRISIGAAKQTSLRDFSLILRLQEEQKMCLWSVVKKKLSIQSIERFLYFPVINYVTFTKRLTHKPTFKRHSIRMKLLYQKHDKTQKLVDICKKCMLRTANPCPLRTRKSQRYRLQLLLSCMVPGYYNSGFLSRLPRTIFDFWISHKNNKLIKLIIIVFIIYIMITECSS